MHSVTPSGPPVDLTLLASLSGTACLLIYETYETLILILCQYLSESAAVS